MAQLGYVDIAYEIEVCVDNILPRKSFTRIFLIRVAMLIMIPKIEGRTLLSIVVTVEDLSIWTAFRTIPYAVSAQVS